MSDRSRFDGRLDPAALAAYRAAGLRDRSRLARAGAAALGRALRRLLSRSAAARRSRGCPA